MTGEVRKRGMGECRRDAKVVRLVGNVLGMASCWTSREAAVVRHRQEETTLAWSGISRIDLILLVGKAGIVRGNTPWDREACSRGVSPGLLRACSAAGAGRLQGCRGCLKDAFGKDDGAVIVVSDQIENYSGGV